MELMFENFYLPTCPLALHCVERLKFSKIPLVLNSIYMMTMELTIEALPPRGGGSAACPKKGQEESETGE